MIESRIIKSRISGHEGERNYIDPFEHIVKGIPSKRTAMPKISVEIPQELLDDLDEHVGDDGKFVNRSDAIRASIRKTLDLLDEIDARHDRLETDE